MDSNQKRLARKQRALVLAQKKQKMQVSGPPTVATSNSRNSDQLHQLILSKSTTSPLNDKLSGSCIGLGHECSPIGASYLPQTYQNKENVISGDMVIQPRKDVGCKINQTTSYKGNILYDRDICGNISGSTTSPTTPQTFQVIESSLKSTLTCLIPSDYTTTLSNSSSISKIRNTPSSATLKAHLNTRTSATQQYKKRAVLKELNCNLFPEVGMISNPDDIQIYDTDKNANHGGQNNREVEADREDEVQCIYLSDYWDIGDASYECDNCSALFWYDERLGKHYMAKTPKFNLCCRGGQVELPFLKEAPRKLKALLFGKSHKSVHFRENIRLYNSMFAFTSMGGKIDRSINQSKGPPTFRLCGQNYHLIGSLIPPNGSNAKFAQLYIYDTQNEIENRMKILRGKDDVTTLHYDIVNDLKSMLDEHNVLAKSFRIVRDTFNNGCNSNIRLRLIGKRGKDGRTYNIPTVDEVAALVVGDFEITRGERDIVVETQSGNLQRISELNPSYLGLQYPLLFPYGEDGYRESIPLNKKNPTSSNGRQYITMKDFFAFRVQERSTEASTLVCSGRLFQQFLVDAYTMIESSRLKYIRDNQKKLRCELYRGLTEAVGNGQTNPSSTGKRIVLPSSFTGGARYMLQNYHDAMAICRSVGYPDLFITFTCNSQWPEIQKFVNNRRLKSEDRPDIVTRVFKIKLDQMIKDIRNNKIFGRVQAVIYTIEFQKRGLPHAHILLFLDQRDKFPCPQDIDKIISAEIPDKNVDITYYQAVENFMMHGPCGITKPGSPCMEDGKCTKKFPKRFVDSTNIDEDGYPVYRRRDDNRTATREKIDLDNRYVVPHNKYLLLKYRAHINVEWCNQARSIKYLFKYVHKGYDRVTAALYQSVVENDTAKPVDEVKMYYDCRYISPCEAAWRIFGFDIHFREPSVQRLSFHLPDQQNVIYEDDDELEKLATDQTVAQTMFLAWFEANKTFEEAKELCYSEFPTRFAWKHQTRKWELRRLNIRKVGRIFFVAPGSGELYYLRLLLNLVKGPTCYEDIRTVDTVVYPTFRDACYARGLLDDDKEYIDAIEEASHWGSGQYLRQLFAVMLFTNCMTRPEVVWEKKWELLSDGILHHQRTLLNYAGLQLTSKELHNLTLCEIEKVLRSNNRTLRDFPMMPYPDMSSVDSFDGCRNNRLILDELRYDKRELGELHKLLLSKATDEQRTVYKRILDAVNSGTGGVFFLYGHGGTGKTYIWNTVAAALRLIGNIVLTVASSGIASLLLPNGRTAHSRFAIPLSLDEFSTCNIKQGSFLAELIIKSKIIIWDEAPMLNRHCFEALDRTMRDLLRFENVDSLNRPFGGKTIVFGGDFRQILPVVKKGSRSDIINATINASYIWDYCQILKLTKNMRLHTDDPEANVEQIKQFSEWILKVGDGDINKAMDNDDHVEIPKDLLIEGFDDPIATIVNETYGEYLESAGNECHLQGRAVLAPTLHLVDDINQYMTALNNNEEKTYLSSDSACMSDSNSAFFGSIHTPEFLNTIQCSGLPNHELRLKVGTPVMLLRNIDHSMGLCNGTRLVITNLGAHVLEAKVMTGINIGQKVFIPRMTLTPSNTKLPFKFQRRQFPIMVSYAMTINKSQGQSLSKVGIYLRKPVFTHGQLYVAISRVTSRQGLKIVICHDNLEKSNETSNVVYKEVFRNL